MKLSNKGRYAVRAVFDLAYHAEDRAAQIKEICERQAIPTRFLEQVFQDLKKAGMVRSKRGPRGGYHLAKEPSELRVGDVIRAIEGPLQLAGSSEIGSSTSEQVLGEVFGELSRELEDCFDRLTVADLCERADSMGLARPAAAKYVYAI